jgi:nitroreductase
MSDWEYISPDPTNEWEIVPPSNSSDWEYVQPSSPVATATPPVAPPFSTASGQPASSSGYSDPLGIGQDVMADKGWDEQPREPSYDPAALMQELVRKDATLFYTGKSTKPVKDKTRRSRLVMYYGNEEKAARADMMLDDLVAEFPEYEKDIDSLLKKGTNPDNLKAILTTRRRIEQKQEAEKLRKEDERLTKETIGSGKNILIQGRDTFIPNPNRATMAAEGLTETGQIDKPDPAMMRFLGMENTPVQSQYELEQQAAQLQPWSTMTGQTVGGLAGLIGTGKIVKGANILVGAEKALAQKFPSAVKYLAPLLNNIETFGLHGQMFLDSTADLKDRAKKAAEDMATGALFTATGALGGVGAVGKIAEPAANAALFYGMAKLSGADEKSAWVNAAVGAMLPSGMKATDIALKKLSSAVMKTRGMKAVTDLGVPKEQAEILVDTAIQGIREASTDVAKPAPLTIEEITKPQLEAAQRAASVNEPSIVEGTGLKNAVADIERIQMGMEPAAQTEKMDFASKLNEGRSVLEKDAGAGERLVNDLASGSPRPVTRTESGVLLAEKVRVANEINAAAEAMSKAKTPQEQADATRRFDEANAKFQNVLDAAKSVGSEAGWTLAFRKLMVREDFSLPTMLAKARSNIGGKALPQERQAKIVEQAKQIEELQAKVAEAEKKASETKLSEEEESAFRRIVNEALAAPTKKMTYGEKALKFFTDAGDAARARIAARRAEGRMMMGIDPIDMMDYAIIGAEHLARGVYDVAAWSARVAKDIGRTFTEKEYDQILTASLKKKSELDSHLDKLDIVEKIRKPATGEPADATASIQSLARAEVEGGVRTLKELVANVHAIVSKEIPGITERQVRDAISGYGKSKQMNQEEAAVVLRDLKAQGQKVSQLEDVMKGKPPAKTGMQRDKPSQVVRDLTKQVHDAMKKMGISVTDPATQLKSTLDSIKTRLKNQIEDLDAALSSKKKLATNQAKIPYDAEALRLKAQRDKLKAAYDELFPKEPMSDQRRLDLAIRTAQRTLGVWENKLSLAKRGIFETPKPTEKPLPNSAKLDALKAERDAIKEEFDALKDLANPKLTPEQRALRAYKSRVSRQTAEIEQRIARQDFTKKPKREIVYDKEAQELQYRLEQVKRQYQEDMVNDWLKNRTTVQKIFGRIGETINTARAIMTGGEFSAVLRQGGWFAFSHPIRTAKSIVPMFKAFRSEQNQFRVEQEIRSRENAPLYKKSGLYLSEPNGPLSKMEEATMNRWAQKIPFISGSQRAYNTFLNKLRADAFDSMVKSLSKDGVPTAEEAKQIAHYINVATGRGSFGVNNESIMVGLNTAFFAPRYVASRFQLLGADPILRSSGRVRKAIAGEYARYLAGIGITYALAQLMGADIEEDPRSTDFGKIKIGNTRIDPLSGLSQTSVFLSRLFTGEKKRSDGKIVPIREKYRPANLFREKGNPLISAKVPYGDEGIIKTFARQKLAPAPGIAWSLLEGRDVIGQPYSLQNLSPVIQTKDGWKFNPQTPLAPITYGDIYQSMIEQGVPKGTAISLLAIFGMGIQNYKEREPKTSGGGLGIEMGNEGLSGLGL